MVDLITPPDPHSLLPPFLACLPTSFASSRPPPALLPLLSPIVRQRIQILSSTSSSPSESWLKLLSWDKQKAEQVQAIVEEGRWEPHPSSGEIEVGDVDTIIYKRFDQDTLRAQIPLQEWNLTAIYLWCPHDEGSSGWKVAELIPYDSEFEKDSTWSTTISEANSSSADRILSEALHDAENKMPGTHPNMDAAEDDDDYWAQYDTTPNRTPANKRSPAPQTMLSRNSAATDNEYYACYGSVQPAMDPTDPSEERDMPKPADSNHSDSGNATNSTLNGNTLAHLLQRQPDSNLTNHFPTFENTQQGDVPTGDDDGGISVSVSQPRPSRSPSSIASAGSEAVARLEQEAESQSSSEIAVRQHISTSMKSMYRLAKSTGMEREEFARMVQRELDVLELLD